MSKNIYKGISLIAALLFFGLLIFVIFQFYPGKDYFDLGAMLESNEYHNYPSEIIGAFFLTIVISVVTLIGSIVLGFLLYLMTSSEIYFLKYVGNIFSEAVFGSPLIVFIVFVYYFMWIYFPFEIISDDFTRFLGGVLALIFYMSPYMKNLFEGSMKTIDPLQYQAMTVFGFTTYQKYRYIIIPQLLRVMIPPLIGNLTFIIKGSTLLNFIGIPELYNRLSFIQSTEGLAVEGYVLMFITYLLITIPLIRLTKYFEKRVASWN